MRNIGFETNITIKLLGIITIFILLSIFIIGTYNAYSTIVINKKFSIPKRVEKYKSLRIAIASDMHFGLLSGKKHAKRLVQNINRLKADIVLFPGDVIDDDPTLFIKKEINEEMKNIKSNLGIFAVMGNHDYYSDKIEKYIKEMEKLNIQMLQDDKTLIDDSFYIIGRKDYSIKKRATIEELTKDINKEKLIILLDHQPYELDRIQKSGVDFSVSGHTHRGQMAPNHLITKKVFEIDWGYLKKESLHVIVSSGFGFWGPAIRIGSRSEIWCIDIEFDK
jgi:hypothetical protein